MPYTVMRKAAERWVPAWFEDGAPVTGPRAEAVQEARIVAERTGEPHRAVVAQRRLAATGVAMWELYTAEGCFAFDAEGDPC